MVSTSEGLTFIYAYLHSKCKPTRERYKTLLTFTLVLLRAALPVSLFNEPLDASWSEGN